MTVPPQGPNSNGGHQNQWSNQWNNGYSPQQQQWQSQGGQYGHYGQPGYQPGYQPQFAQQPPQQQPQQPQTKKGAKRWLALLLVIVLALVAGVAWLTDGFGLLRGEAPTYEARFDTGRQFLGDFSNPEAELDVARLKSLAKDLDAPTGEVVGSDAPGIYGTGGEADACEASDLANLFVDEAEHTRDFAEIIGVDPEEMSSYIMGLTSTYLARDTWVTNYYLDDAGQLASYQSVMEAGTAVLVDSYGVPRVRCASGSPLQERNEDLADPRSGEPTWEDYNGKDVVSVAPGDELDELDYIDVNNGDLRKRPLGAGRTGAVQVQLTWDTDADMDLHLETAYDNDIYWGNAYADGGELDVDMCVRGTSGGCGTAGNIENIFWEDSAPGGTYEAWVNNYSDNGNGAVDYKLRVFVEGVKVAEDEGTLTEDEGSARVSFDVEEAS